MGKANDRGKITSQQIQLGEHSCHYQACGPEDGPLIIFVHGWPEQSQSWRHQLPVFGGLGFRAIAPDMRGYGKSTVYPNHSDYAQEQVVGDLLALHAALGGAPAIWVGHDWGSPSVWNIASHHPERCRAIASLCVPYYTLERGLPHCLQFVDRTIYPEETFPAGQWEYMHFYAENFDLATRDFEANSYNSVKALFRKGDPDGFGKPSATAMTRINGSWFGPAGEAPDVPMDADVVTDEDLQIYAEALARNSWFGPDSYYMNHTANAQYAAQAVNGARLEMPVLFIAAQYDYTCETISSRLAVPMREYCTDLTEKVLHTGHWMAQEQPEAVNHTIMQWLSSVVSLSRKSVAQQRD